MQHDLPLCVARRWHSHLRAFAQVDLLPWTPVAIRIVDVPAARQHIHITRAAKFRASPARENLGIEHVALVRALVLRSRTEHKNLAQIAARRIEPTVWGFREPCHLRCRSL